MKPVQLFHILNIAFDNNSNKDDKNIHITEASVTTLSRNKR